MSRPVHALHMEGIFVGALDQLNACQWPGNVRELENAVERALILRKSESLLFSDLQSPSSVDTEQFAYSIAEVTGFPDAFCGE